MDDAANFSSLGIKEPLLAALTALGYEEPTPIQMAAIPALLAGKDLVGQAATGTGKTAAFALPLLSRVTRDRATRALVLVPTRELAIQVAEAIHRYGRALETTVLAVYGGAPIMVQVKALSRGITVVVATPGRALDLLRRKSLRLDAIEQLVLDEADEMLDMGFAEDLEAILDATPATRQTALFSATMPPRIAALAKKYLRDPERVSIANEKLPAGELPKVRQVAYVVARAHKLAALGRVLDMESPTSAIVFCRTRTEVDELTESLKGRGYTAEALHGGLSQDQRDRVMKRFRASATDLLIATDVAARGLDIDHLSHVVNFDVPAAAEQYVHRIGRTGRAGREGVAISFVEPREQRMLRNIEGLTRQRIEVAAIPSVADLRSRRLDTTRVTIREAILAGGLDAARVVVESLVTEFDAKDIAAAAVKLVHALSGGAEDEIEIPAFRPPVKEKEKSLAKRLEGKPSFAAAASERSARGPTAVKASAGAKSPTTTKTPHAATTTHAGTAAHPAKTTHAGTTAHPAKTTHAVKTAPTAKTEHAAKSPPATKAPNAAERFMGKTQAVDDTAKKAERPSARKADWAVARLWIGLGRQAGIKPGDLVGCITNEANIEGWAIGAIQIDLRHSVVEVPAEIIGDVISALRAATIRGKKFTVRRDRDHE